MDLENNNILFISGEVLKNLTTFSIPEGITNFNTNINSYTNITKIIIPQSLTTISLAAIFPTSISSIEITDGNTNFVVENECLYNGNKTELIMCYTKNTEVDLADEVITIKAHSFLQAPNIENVYFDGNITIIEAEIFSWGYNPKLKEVYIGSNVEYIAPGFKYQNYYGTVIVDEANQKYSIEDNILYNKDKTEFITALYNIQGTYKIKEDVIKIGDGAFTFQTEMTEVILPEGLKEIGDSFQYCTGLTEIYIPNSVEKIGTSAFANATNLMHIRIDKAPNTIEGAPWGAISWDRAVEWLRPAE